MIALWLALATAHPLAPPAIEVVHDAAGTHGELRQSRLSPPVEAVWPCPVQGREQVDEDEAVVLRVELDCADWGPVGLRGPGPALVTVRRPGEQVQRAVLGTDETWDVRPRPVVRSFLALGVEHVLFGWDHLLFLAAIAIAAKERRDLLVAISAFTVGHALSLLLVALGWVAPPALLVECAIAGSIVLLAAREKAGRGWLCLGLGAVHGLGMGAALRGLLADGPLLGALVGFNIGVELAQLAAVGLALLVLRPLPRLPTRFVLGAVGASFLWERLAALL